MYVKFYSHCYPVTSFNIIYILIKKNSKNGNSSGFSFFIKIITYIVMFK